MTGFGVDELVERAHWRPLFRVSDVRIVDRPEILYTVCPRDVPGINRVRRTRAAISLLPALVDEVSRAHRATRSLWMVPENERARSLEAAIDRRGYRPKETSHAYCIAVSSFRPRSSEAFVVRPVDDRRGVLDALGVMRLGYEDGREFTPEEIDCYERVSTGADRMAHQFVAYSRTTEEPVSSGGLTHLPELGFALLWGGSTVPAARGRGAYSAVLAARVGRARELGCDLVGLYARSETSGPVVEQQGFRRYGPMTLWERPRP